MWLVDNTKNKDERFTNTMDEAWEYLDLSRDSNMFTHCLSVS